MISVITPVYNGESFIESCIKVVIEQNCSDVEHIIIDGGSQDKTVEIIQQYADQYPHIRWISEGDQGQSDAMNKGINLAKGEIITILNVDDFYEPNVLNRVLDIFKTLPENSFLVGNCQVWNINGNVRFINKPNKLNLADLLLGWSVYPHPINPSAYFYHKSLHDEVGLYKIEDHYTMDLDFILRVVQKAKVKYVDEIFGNYRYIPGTKTFKDRRKGEGKSRFEPLFAIYYQQLSPLEKVQFMIKNFWLKKFLSKIKHFLKHPDKLLPYLTRKPN
ncbi:glycosyl transferase, family 2 [Crocosphaera subtropica ATCC 51142]|uniref:Glycosyl transferase, family 2 n=1 Tax=Crocosphaera subtropica (strain ATCC 51142 / BH68) TaxID=43989 RepID=B1WUA5_CROS5|nr:glycosyltransferase family 2 protein [Crocosphaera subtropica]ACB52167.1 glycosyl transferase, family 2 [Crocosphaera subtropica ATCC 51142]